MHPTFKLILAATLLSGCAAVNEPIRDDATRIERSCLGQSRGGTTIDTFATPVAHPSQCVVLGVVPGGHGSGYLYGDPCSEVGRRLRAGSMREFDSVGVLLAESVSVAGTSTFTTDYLTTPHPVVHDVTMDFGEGRVFRIAGEDVADWESCFITPTGL